GARAAVPRRRGAALAVTADGERYSLIEAPFHLADTLASDPRFAPAAGSRHVPIDSLLLTCGELDACAGALAFSRGLSLRIVSQHDLREALVEHDASFRTLAASFSGHAFDRPFPLDRDGHLEARLFPLPGPVPEALRELAPKAGRARAGVRITDLRTGSRLVFAPRIARYDGATLAELRAADLRLVDGTCLIEEEGRLIHPGVRGASDLGHLPIDGRDGSLVWLSGMTGRSVYLHLAASNPACETGSKEWTRIHEAGVLVAEDGQELSL
ncbi:MAG: hypothetical protein K2X91_11000, partial [Thermoleophilia bacterium]|nr:hypothetical protein [Thermoleophilia bacterium]